MKTPVEWANEIASACPEKPGAADCPYHWNACRRHEKCEMREEVAEAVQQIQAEALEERADRLMQIGSDAPLIPLTSRVAVSQWLREEARRIRG